MNHKLNQKRMLKGYAVSLTAMALVFVWLGAATHWRAEARASRQDNSVCYTNVTVLGLTSGQQLRASVGTIVGTKGDIEWAYRISTSDNQILFQSERVVSPAGQWRYSTVSREDLNIDGESETGRVQVMVQLGIKAKRSTKASDIINSLEVIENGRTAVRSSNVIDAFFQFGCSECPPPPPV